MRYAGDPAAGWRSGSAGEPVEGGADLVGVHRVGGQGAVQDQALDQRVDLPRGHRIEVTLEAAAAAGHPVLGDRTQGRVAGRGDVELDGEHQVTPGAEQVAGEVR